MRRRKFLAGARAGALAAIPGFGHADPQSPGKSPEGHPALPAVIAPSAFANVQTYQDSITKRCLREAFGLLGQKWGAGYGDPFHYTGPDAYHLDRIHDAAMKEAVDL